jgi:uncharacterized membrane protein
MNTSQSNVIEWNDAKNWSRMGMFGVYFSKTDTRVFVPKATPIFGWTLNLGHRNAVLTLTFTILAPIVVALAVVLVSTAG